LSIATSAFFHTRCYRHEEEVILSIRLGLLSLSLGHSMSGRATGVVYRYRNLYNHRNATLEASLTPAIDNTGRYRLAPAHSISHIMTFYWTTQSDIARPHAAANTLPFDANTFHRRPGAPGRTGQ